MSDPASRLRIGDAERAAAADRLASHFSHGRLDQAELDERLGRAMRATTAGDLSALFADLPAAEPVPAAGAPERPRPHRTGRPRPARAARRAGLDLIVLAVCVIAGMVLLLRALTHFVAVLAVILLVAVLWMRRRYLRTRGSPPSTL